MLTRKQVVRAIDRAKVAWHGCKMGVEELLIQELTRLEWEFCLSEDGGTI